MRLRVQHEDGRVEIITLVPPVKVVLGINLNYLSCGDGTDFFFTQDGFYDGWGRNLSGVTEKEADRDIDRMEAAREIEESGDVHVMPTFDGFDHKSSSDCACGPDENYKAQNGNKVWVHKVIQ